jgi:hypothetical protein
MGVILNRRLRMKKLLLKAAVALLLKRLARRR